MCVWFPDPQGERTTHVSIHMQQGTSGCMAPYICMYLHCPHQSTLHACLILCLTVPPAMTPVVSLHPLQLMRLRSGPRRPPLVLTACLARFVCGATWSHSWSAWTMRCSRACRCGRPWAEVGWGLRGAISCVTQPLAQPQSSSVSSACVRYRCGTQAGLRKGACEGHSPWFSHCRINDEMLQEPAGAAGGLGWEPRGTALAS